MRSLKADDLPGIWVSLYVQQVESNCVKGGLEDKLYQCSLNLANPKSLFANECSSKIPNIGKKSNKAELPKTGEGWRGLEAYLAGSSLF